MYSMDPWAIMNNQEIWAQPSPPANSTIVTEVMMVTSCLDSRATAGSKRLLGVSDKTDQAEDVDARIELTWQTYGVHKAHRRQQMIDAALEIIRKYNENEGKDKKIDEDNHADTLIAVIKTLAVAMARPESRGLGLAFQSSGFEKSKPGPQATISLSHGSA